PLELVPKASSDGSRIDENKPRWPEPDASRRRFAGEKQSEKATPGVSNYRERLHVQLVDDELEIADMGLPGDGRLAVRGIGARSSAPTLIVEEQFRRRRAIRFGETQHLRQQVVVMRAGPAVQEQKLFATGRAVYAPVQRYVGGCRE